MKIIDHPSIIKSGKIRDQHRSIPHRIVLRHEPGSLQPYITHMENLEIKDGTFVHESFYWGHYFSNLEDAEKDFLARK